MSKGLYESGVMNSNRKETPNESKTQELSRKGGGRKRSFLRGETGGCLPSKAAHVLWSHEVSMADLGKKKI